MPGNYGINFRAPKVDVHNFAMVPRAEIPRSSFRMQNDHKTTIDASYLTPIYLQEVLPGDSFNVSMTAFCRLSTPIYPLMDNLDLETFFFFVPNRLVWINWQKFMGEQDNPADSINFSIPQVVSPVGGFAQLSIYDYFGLPCTGQTAGGNTISVSALPFRAYQLCFNHWFRDQNLDNSVGYGSTNSTGIAAMDNGPDPQTNYTLLPARKRHDYFTSCLPWTQKGGNAVTLPLTGNATVRTQSANLVTGAGPAPIQWLQSTGGSALPTGQVLGTLASGQMTSYATPAPATASFAVYPANLYADLSTVTAATINSLRLSFQTQKLLERDARSGSRYQESCMAHFGVMPPDYRVQKPEYLGGGKSPLTMTPVPQTTATGLTGGSSPIGTLSAAGTFQAGGHGFRQAFTEHGHIIGIALVRQTMGYQQGIRRLWKRSTRFDFYYPVFSMIGEQPVYNYEIYSDGSANDALVFGYQEAWAPYRYHPSFTSGYFRSTNSTPLDSWHLVEKFGGLPTLNNIFIIDSTTTQVRRGIAAGAAGNRQQVLCDFFFDQKVARAMPMYSVPGLIDHF